MKYLIKTYPQLVSLGQAKLIISEWTQKTGFINDQEESVVAITRKYCLGFRRVGGASNWLCAKNVETLQNCFIF